MTDKSEYLFWYQQYALERGVTQFRQRERSETFGGKCIDTVPAGCLLHEAQPMTLVLP